MKSLNKLIFIAILASVSSYAASETLETVDVENFNNVWASGFDQGNTEALMGLYSENAVVFPPSSEILEGRKAIQTYLQGLKEVGVKEYSISNIDTDIKENTVYESALWEATRVDSEGNIIKLEGNISNVFERQNDGSWKIKFQSWN
jgi:ketosteroid isomerase-like protein